MAEAEISPHTTHQPAPETPSTTAPLATADSTSHLSSEPNTSTQSTLNEKLDPSDLSKNSQHAESPTETPAPTTQSVETATNEKPTSNEENLSPFTTARSNQDATDTATEDPARPSAHFTNAPRPFPTEPPSLNYTLKGRKRWILIFWTLIIFDSVAIPLGVYFGLWFGLTRGQLSANAVFSISTACLGGVSIAEYFLRFWRLWKKGSTCRVIGAKRAYLDWFHWNFSIAWAFIMVELIVGTIPDWPPIRLLAMPVSSLLFWFAFQLFVVDTLRIMGYRQPLRISSVPKGALFRPGIYSIIEDVVAVDGSGGTEFRTRLNARFEASHYFRQMLHRLTLFWAAGCLLAAVVTTVLVFTLTRNPAYVVGWVLPFIWAGIWAACTVWYVKRELAHERKEWGKPRAMSNLGRYSLDA